MLSGKLHTTVVYSIASLLFLFHAVISFSQENQPPIVENIHVQFLKDSMEIEGNSFEFNSCSLIYAGEGTLFLDAKIEAPASIKIVSTLVKSEIQLQKSQQQFIPIRFIYINTTKTTWQPIIIHFEIKATGKQFSKQFWIKSKAYSRWNARLLQQDITVALKEQKTPFSFVVENTGTTEDEYKISIASKIDIEQNKKDLQFILEAGEKKIVTLNADLSFFHLHNEHTETIEVSVKNKYGNQRFLIQNISVMAHQYSQDFYSWRTMPLSVEFTAQSSLSGSPLFSTAVNGIARLGQGRSISVNSRINDVRKLNTYNTASLEYATPKWDILVGTIVDFHHFLIHGTGLSISDKFTNGRIIAAGIQSSLGKVKQGELQLYDTLAKNFTLYTDNFTNQDEYRNIYSSLSVNHIYWNINKNTTLSLLAGASIEKGINWKFTTRLPGSAFGYEIETQLWRINLHSELSNYSKSFPGFNRGYTFQDHEISTKFKDIRIGGFYTTNKKVYTDNEDSLLTNLFNINNTEYGLKTGASGRNVSLSLSSSISRQQQDSSTSIIVNSWKTTANIIYKIAPEYTFSISGSFGWFSIKDRPDLKPFPAYTSYGSFQHKQLGLFFQYSSGPYYYFETKQYLLSNRKFETILLAPYYDHQLKKINGFFRTQLLYNKDASANMNNISLNNQLQFSVSKIKTDFILNTSYNFNYKAASYLAATVRKNLNLPVSKNAVSNSYSIILFKDINNNDQYDNNIDEIIPYSTVEANGIAIQSDENGEIMFTNVGNEAVRVDFSNTNFNGWIPKAGFIQKIFSIKKHEKIYLAFKRSRYIKGKLNLVTDDKSSETFELSNIGITATDEKGNSFKTLTDNNGEFTLNLPAANYIISINTTGFDNNFKPTEISKVADLVNNEKLDITFEIRQKRRQINIHQSSD